MILNENCDRYEYIMKFLNKLMIGVRDSINTVKEAVELEVKDNDGKVVRRERVEPECVTDNKEVHRDARSAGYSPPRC